MSKSLRLTEKWMRRGLWLVAVVFASFLIGLGSTLVGDLPKVEKQLSLDDYMDAATSTAVRNAIKKSEVTERDAESALEQAQLKSQVAQADSVAARETFKNWLSTRQATQLADQDPELIARTRALDTLKDKERAAGAAVEARRLARMAALPSRVMSSPWCRMLPPLGSIRRSSRRRLTRGKQLRVNAAS